MVNCPNGHPNPAGWELCGECGAPIDAIEPPMTTWYQTKWAIVGGSLAAVLAFAGGAVAFLLTKESSSPAPPPPASVAIQEWWSGAHKHFGDLQTALDDLEYAAERFDGSAMAAACRQIHDTAEVDLQAHLPTPDPDVTSELAAAVEDAHAAAHMCLAVVAGSPKSFVGEFEADIDQVERHLAAAQELINEALTASP